MNSAVSYSKSKKTLHELRREQHVVHHQPPVTIKQQASRQCNHVVTEEGGDIDAAHGRVRRHLVAHDGQVCLRKIIKVSQFMSELSITVYMCPARL